MVSSGLPIGYWSLEFMVANEREREEEDNDEEKKKKGPNIESSPSLILVQFDSTCSKKIEHLHLAFL